MRSLAATISLKVSAILPMQADLVAGHADREVADPHGLQRVQQVVQLGRRAAVETAVGGLGEDRARAGTPLVLSVANRLALRLHSLLRDG